MRKQQQGSGYGGRRVKATESTQQVQRAENHQNMQNKGKAWRHGLGKKSSIPLVPSPPGGSGMRAIFLGGSERKGSSGTGVFLPSGTYTTPEPKKKSGTYFNRLYIIIKLLLIFFSFFGFRITNLLSLRGNYLIQYVVFIRSTFIFTSTQSYKYKKYRIT